MKRQTFIEISCLLFILLFVYAATSKLIDYQKFRVQLGQSPMLTSFAGFAAWSVPSIEIIIALLLAIPKFRLTGLYASFGLMTLFTVYIFTITHYSEFVPCSCGGVLQNMTWGQHFIFNIAFVMLAATAILLNRLPANQRYIAMT